MTIKKYNFSIRHIFIRIFLTGVIGILFILAMFPFMRTANGLLYEQRAAIGGENFWRIVILWAVYTFILLLLTFWRKRFRMVGIFLVCLWILGTSLVIFIQINDSGKRCSRSYPYEIPSEFDRALNLIAQRLQVEQHSDSYYGYAYNFRNCLDIQYSDILNNDKGAEGVFLQGNSSLQDLKILVKPEYKSYDDLTIATLLIHELTHVGQFVSEQETDKKLDCYSKEAEAFTTQSILLSQLNNEERRSIYARIKDNLNINPAFPIILLLDEKTGESYNACSKLKIENNLTQEQFNECVWTGTKNQLELEVKQNTYYQNQCSR